MAVNTNPESKAKYVVRLADDALIYGQRLCEWCSRAPTLEEDLALANVALDYIGRARLLFNYAQELTGRDEDDYAFRRDVREFSNVLIVELPNGDFAHTLIRQFCLDEFEMLYLQAMMNLQDSTLAQIARKSIKETNYHLRRSQEWVRRLGLGTQESRRRALDALESLSGYLPELFAMDELETELAVVGQAVDRSLLYGPWLASVSAGLTEASLALCDTTWQVEGGRRGIHTEHMGPLLAEMQFVQRAYPDMQW